MTHTYGRFRVSDRCGRHWYKLQLARLPQDAHQQLNWSPPRRLRVMTSGIEVLRGALKKNFDLMDAAKDSMTFGSRIKGQAALFEAFK